MITELLAGYVEDDPLSASDQAGLFEAAPKEPEGLVYRPDVLSAAEEAALASAIERLPLKPFEFHGYLGKRRVTSFGWRYAFAPLALGPAFGIYSMLKLRRLPEATQIAQGRR